MSNSIGVEKNTSARRTGYRVLLGLTVVLAVLAIVTTLPMSASKTNLLGYFSCCSFMPLSTLALLALAGVSCKIRSRFCR